MDQPRWLEIARAELGQREVAGSADNDRVLAYYRDAGHPEVRHDETAWCAAFVGACLMRAGLKGTGSLMARSYLNWGEPIETPRIGAVAVLPRGSDPAAGHVGFVVGEKGSGILLLGGNQGDAVSVATFPRSGVLGFRWPAQGGAQAMKVSERVAGEAGFEAALAHVLEMEGGWSEDPYDPGGPTNFGITLATYAAHRGLALEAGNFGALRQELKSIDRATVFRIYRERYWKPCRADALPPALALMHFDAAVNHGVGGAARILQEAVGAEVDSEIGPRTIAAAQSVPMARALDAYADIRRRRYRALPHFWRFGRGWLARVDKTLAHARTLTATTSDTQKDQDMTEQTAASSAGAGDAGAKWWGESMTVWGAALTALTTVVPVLAPLIGLDITGEMVRQLGDQAVKAVQAIGGLAGTVLTIWGRARATRPLERRDVSVRL